jgi:hypothetical protein
MTIKSSGAAFACMLRHRGEEEHVLEKSRRRRIKATRPDNACTTKRIFGPLAEAGAAAYSRARDLPKLIALWPHELDDHTLQGCLLVLAKLRSALRTERQRARSGHWSYDLNRHLGLLGELKAQPTCTRRGRDADCD